MAEAFEGMSFILTAFGVLLVLEGIPYFGFPAKVKRWALMLQGMSDGSLRLLGLAIMAFGLILIYAVKSGF